MGPTYPGLVVGGCEALAHFNGVQGSVACEPWRQLQTDNIIVDHELEALERWKNAELCKPSTLCYLVPEPTACMLVRDSTNFTYSKCKWIGGKVVGTHCDSWMCCRQDRGCSPITNVCEMWAGAQIVSLSVVSFGSLSRSAAATSRAEWISVSSSGQDPTARAGNDVRNQTPC